MGLQRTSVMSIFLVIFDRPSLTLLLHLCSPFPEKKGKGSYDFPDKWSLLTRLRKPIASQCIPNVRLLVPVI